MIEVAVISLIMCLPILMIAHALSKGGKKSEVVTKIEIGQSTPSNEAVLLAGLEGSNEKDISEPVISFLEELKSNPKRFTISIRVNKVGGFSDTIKCKIRDNLTEEVFEVNYYPRNWKRNGDYFVNITHKWLTNDELRYVAKHLFDTRSGRWKAVVNKRIELRQRRNEAERERLEAIYKKE